MQWKDRVAVTYGMCENCEHLWPSGNIDMQSGLCGACGGCPCRNKKCNLNNKYERFECEGFPWRVGRH